MFANTIFVIKSLFICLNMPVRIFNSGFFSNVILLLFSGRWRGPPCVRGLRLPRADRPRVLGVRLRQERRARRLRESVLVHWLDQPDHLRQQLLGRRLGGDPVPHNLTGQRTPVNNRSEPEHPPGQQITLQIL